MTNRARLLLCCILAFAPSLFGRVLSYAPYTNRDAMPSFHHRASRWFALTEGLPGQPAYGQAQVVLYDALGFEEPRVIYPSSGGATILFVAVRENRFLLVGPGPVNPSILISTYEYIAPTYKQIYLLSNDGGKTFTRLRALDGVSCSPSRYDVDYGGPYSHGMKANTSLIVGDLYPFILDTLLGIFSIDHIGNVKLLHPTAKVIGRDRSGGRLLVNHAGIFKILDAGGVLTPLDNYPVLPSYPSTGWITDDGSVYLETVENGFRYFYLYRDLGRIQLAGPVVPSSELTFFAVPASDYNGAWMIQRGSGKPTTLSRHTIAKGIETFWSDVSGPQVEALHTAGSPDKLLIQVHRPRAQAERFFLDPALALWRAGEPAPRAYDELFLNEGTLKGFVHLDVDTVAEGAPFVFDSGGFVPCINCSPGGGGAGGGDVVQEWGVVRASLKQRLVLPGIARQAGAFGSYWLSDLVIHNPLDTPQNVDVRFVPILSPTQISALVLPKTITLAPREIAVYRDIVKSLFGIDGGGGVIYIDPKVAVSATARTYTRAGNGGSFGFGMQAIDFLNAASPRFPVTFAGAFPGTEYRTNLLLTDTSGRGSEARLRAHGLTGLIGADDIAFGVPVSGAQQLNGIAGSLGLTQTDSGGLAVQPMRGSMIVTVVAMDNRTNDPTFFPPDLPAPNVRTIPVIGHVDGANNSKFRSDLYLLNPSTSTRTVTLEAKRWDSNETPRRVPYTLLPGEARVIRDALPTIFGITGIARFRYSSGDGDGVRITSRTYNINDDGGTFGCLVPPLNAFQSAGPGETLEILGITGGSDSRTNLGLVDLTPAYDGKTAEARIHIVDQNGHELDHFTITLATAAGTQINDIFNARGIAQPAAAIVYVEVTKGLIGAYATLTDNVTNDSTYLGASLSAQD